MGAFTRLALSLIFCNASAGPCSMANAAKAVVDCIRFVSRLLIPRSEKRTNSRLFLISRDLSSSFPMALAFLLGAMIRVGPSAELPIV